MVIRGAALLRRIARKLLARDTCWHNRLGETYEILASDFFEFYPSTVYASMAPDEKRGAASMLSVV